MMRFRWSIGFLLFLLGLAPLAMITVRNSTHDSFPPRKARRPPLRWPDQLGEFEITYLSRFDAGVREQKDSFLISDIELKTSGTEETVVITLRVSPSLHSRLLQLTENVFSPSELATGEDIEASYRELIAAGRPSLVYLLPYVFSTEDLDARSRILLPTPYKHSRVRSLGLKGHLAAIAIGRLTGLESRAYHYSDGTNCFMSWWLQSMYAADTDALTGPAQVIDRRDRKIGRASCRERVYVLV